MSREPEGAVVQLRALGKRYRRRRALDAVDLTIRPGELYGLIGPDGAGKSSLMKIIAGVLRHDTGRVEVFGVALDSEAQAERIKDRVGFMPQGLGLNLYPELSVEENIDFFARLRLVSGRELAERKRRLLAMTRLDRFRDRPMKQLSGGMKQKLGLACTLIHAPALIILDEPTTGIDPVSRRDFWAILAELLGEHGTTALVSTAYMDEASRFHRVALLYAGRVLAEGEPDAIQALVPGSLVALRCDRQVEAYTRLRALLPQVETLGPWLRAFLDGTGPEAAIARIRAALRGIPVHALHVTEPELEDVFIALLRRQRLAWPDARAETPAGAPAPRRAGYAIEALALTRDFGRFRAVDRGSFRVAAGEIFGLLGANGAGKTTMIKMLTGILPPSSGSARVAGADTGSASRAVRERIGYMSQAFSLYTDLTVLENIRLYAGVYGLDGATTRRRSDWVLDLAGLAGHEDEHAGRLPMGLRQRLALGCALVHGPEVLFLDEPTSGVDPIGRRRFWDILFRLAREQGVAILVTTHYLSEAEHCDHLALMYAGRIVADASPAAMKQQVEAEAGRLLEVTTDRPIPAMKALIAAGFREPALFGRHLHLLSREPDRDAARIHAVLGALGIQAGAIVPRPLSMEDVFVYRVTALEQRGHGEAPIEP